MRRREFDDDDEDEDEAAAAGGEPLIPVPGVRETTFLFTFEEKGALLRGKAWPIFLVIPTPPQQHSTAGIR